MSLEDTLYDIAERAERAKKSYHHANLLSVAEDPGAVEVSFTLPDNLDSQVRVRALEDGEVFLLDDDGWCFGIGMAALDADLYERSEDGCLILQFPTSDRLLVLPESSVHELIAVADALRKGQPVVVPGVRSRPSGLAS